MAKANKNICIIGLGYIGLPTSALLASKGYQVFGVDNNPAVVDVINKGNIHIIEPKLKSYVKSAIKSSKLQAFLKPQRADIYIICVPTPFSENKNSRINPTPDLKYVIEAVESISPLIKSGDMIILESTSPVGTTEKIKEILDSSQINTSTLSIGYCPERVLPGKIMDELVDNDRIVGGLNDMATDNIAHFYETFVNGKVLKTNANTAEMCKLAENSFRDLNIAFANELSMITDQNGVNIWELIKLANHHPRVNILEPGAGVGGHCIAVDPWFLVASDPVNTPLIQTARKVNNQKPTWIADKVLERAISLENKLKRKIKIACFGLAFKPNIDDLSETPALAIAEKIQQKEADLIVVEPNIKSIKGFNLHSIESAIENADLAVILVNHREFNLNKFRSQLSKIEALNFCGII